MANNSPTIVAASLSDDQLKKSIDSLVSHVDKAMKKMVQSTNNAVGEMEAKLKSLGNLKIDSNGTADGGASKRAKAQNAETDAVEKNIAARDKQIKKNQEAATSFDNFTKAQQVAIRSASPSGIRNADTLQTMNIQLDLLRERLREARQQYSSFVALAAHATTTGDKGLFQYATDGVHRYEQEVRNLIPQIRTLQSGIQQMGDVIAPQGHTIQNYVNSLQKANPELAQLNEQFKRGKSLLQQQKTEFEQNAQAQRNSTNQQKQTLDEMNAYIRQNIQREQERREAIRQTGLAAQDAFAKIRQNAQIQLAENTDKPIKGIKELADAITNMRRLYFDMSTAEKESPLGLALKRDIENAQKLKFAIDAYNRTLSGMTVIGTKNNANSSLGAYTELTNILKTLSDEYKRLGREERNAAKGNDLADKIQRLSRATQKIQQQMNRPISFAAAMKGDEKTLDDIAYKMQRLRSYRQGIDLTKPNAANEIKQVDEALAKLQKDADKWMSKSQEMIKNNTALGRSWNYMKNRLAFYFTVGASTQFIKNLIDVRSQYEMNERALGILINSAERGTQIFNELSQMALVSPYTLIELSAAAKQLTAYDIAAKDVVDTTRRLADMASAVGIPIERLTYALGQIKAYGYLNSRDARMFANAGIPLVKQLSDYYTQLEGRLVSTADVYDRIKKKTIDYEQVVQVINNMTDEGGKFFDFQAKMADTLKVRLANLTLAWNNMLNDIGSSNQGVLTSGIGALRDMFLHWKDIESIINKVAVAFGIYKTAQLVSLVWTGRITTAMGVQELVGKKLQARLASLTATQGGFLSAATTGWAALAFVVADVFLTISRNAEEIERLNKTIADGAKESYESLDKMLHSSEMISTRLSALQGKLSDTDAAKAWEMLREQIELSSASSKELIAELIKQPDLNKRVTESFNLAEKIEEANRKLSDLSDNLDVTQNSILFGLFGEGLAEDIDDYNERIKYTAEVAEWSAKKNKGFWENAAMGLSAIFNEVKDAFGSDSEEAQNEIKNFSKKAAQTIKDELGEEGIKDKIQVNEAIARVVRGMEQQFPQIRGKGKVLFETIFYDTMATEFKGAVDGQAYYYEKFLEQLKKDHASAFSGVTEDINKETFKWSSAQIDAIQKTADKVKKDLPAASQGAIDEILRQLNSTDFKVRIVAEMATTSLDNVQKQFREKFIEKPWIADDKEREKAENEANQRYGTLMRKNTESNAEYEKRISDERKKQLELSQKNADIITKNKGKQEEFSKAVLADAQKQKEAADNWLKAAKDIENKGGYDFSTKGEKSAARKAAKQAETELQKALKDELSTIEKVRSIYKDLTKEGMSHANAVERATRGWDETVNAINRVLQKNGLQKLDLSKFAGIENPRELVNMLQSQLNTLLKRGAKPAEIKELQTKVNTLEVDADKYDLTKITKGLNNELGKLKDEYELAVELDANPELGGMFLDMFGIDPSDFSHSIDDYMFKVQSAFEKARRELGYGVTIDVFKANDEEWKKWGEWVGLSGEALDNFKARFVNAQNVVKKVVKDTATKTKDLEYKLADTQGKIVIETTKLKKMEADRQVADEKSRDQSLTAEQRVYFAEQKNLLDLQIKDQEQTIARLGDEVLQMLPTYQNLFNSIVEHSDVATRKIAKQWKDALTNAVKNVNGTYTITDPNDPKKTTTITSKQYGTEVGKVDKELRKGMSSFKKIKEAFTKGEDKTVDWAKGIELLGGEIGKVGGIVSSIGDFAEKMGFSRETVEIINDVATSLNGVSTMAQGIGQIASGDYIGGAASVLSGLTTAVSTWFDNADNKITDQIKESELAVKRLENAYKNLEFAIENAYGANVIGAKQAAIANKELQLAELNRQLALEKSRDGKNRDEDKIVELQGQIIDLRNEIKRSSQEIATDLLGISNVGDAALSFMDAYIESLRKGEDAQASFSGSWKDMIANMIKQLYVTKVIGPQLEALIENMNERIKSRSEKETDAYQKAVEEQTRTQNMTEEELKGYLLGNSDEWKKLIEERNSAYAEYFSASEYGDAITQAKAYRDYALAQEKVDEYYRNFDVSSYQKEVEQNVKDAKRELDKATAPTINDLSEVAKAGQDLLPMLEASDASINEMLKMFDLYYDEDSKNNLSALQQGISGITEDTAGALEAYMNGVSQQVYLHSDLLTQIRDAVVGMDMDIQIGTLSEILLQLQSSYQIQMSIRDTLQGWSNASGMAVRVEMV